jgi:outer membrane murein-binding lipoprotein Lpp
MKKILAGAIVPLTLTGLLLAGCRSEEPKNTPGKETIQTAADKAHEVIDKTAAASQTLAEKAEELKATARQAATDMSATILKDSERDPAKADEPKPADTQK